MKKRLLVCMMALVLGLTGCSGKSDNSSTGGDTVKETEKERDYYGNKYREEYDVAYWTYIGVNCKYLMDSEVEYMNMANGKWGISPVNSKIMFSGIQESDGDIFDIDFSKKYSEEEMVQVGIPLMKLNWSKLYEVPTSYSHDIIEFNCDDIKTIEVGDYEFVQGCGKITVPPTDSGIKNGLEPIQMDAVCYVRKMADGSYFVFYQFADSRMKREGKKQVTIDEMKDYAMKLLKTYKEYDCEYSDFNEGV